MMSIMLWSQFVKQGRKINCLYKWQHEISYLYWSTIENATTMTLTPYIDCIFISYLWPVIIVHAGGLALSGARTSVITEITNAYIEIHEFN